MLASARFLVCFCSLLCTAPALALSLLAEHGTNVAPDLQERQDLGQAANIAELTGSHPESFFAGLFRRGDLEERQRGDPDWKRGSFTADSFPRGDLEERQRGDPNWEEVASPLTRFLVATSRSARGGVSTGRGDGHIWMET
ncbi:hypothetical protein DFH08DRAFT_818503 [Mycena albidolilacea]|uniref:Uncharacterized protein n=1 Tax=Mycena albidolilacea TaxID=1033008 RepID=A0AAD7EHK7_9AGAR|nr:hypothetical protein DFH08DRAFT_818503 [Mycena albidolilacea]